MAKEIVLANNAERLPLFGIPGNPGYIAKARGISHLHILGDIKRLGTQRMYGRKGASIVAEDYHGNIFIIARTVNPQFVKAVRRVLPYNGLTDSVRIIWSEMAVWAEAVDTYLR